MKQFRLLLLLALLMTAVTGAVAQTGVTKGSFSVSATKRVYFSKGNLQLVGENTFQFAENQWDYFGSNQSDNHRDLFCWGTGNNPNQTTGNSTFTDWGDNTYLQATLGKGWRTLTKDEFVYVFNTRSSGSSVFDTADGRYTTATINTDGTGVNGFILFPDGITIAASEVKTPGTINNKGTVTQCTKAQWAALAEKGCVFLPAGGFILSGSGIGHGDITDYWSSTAADASKAYNLNFNFGYQQGGVNPAGNLGYNYGCAVRLVIDQYYLTLKDGTEDAAKWTATVGTSTTANPLPVGGLSEGDAVTLNYGGRLKVKSVTATTDAKPAAGKTVDLSTYTGTSYEVTEDVTFTGTTNNEISILYKGDDYEVTLDNVNAPKCFIAAQDDYYNINVKLKGTSRLMGIYTQNANVTIGEAAAGGTVILVDESPLGGNGTEVTINGGTVKAKATASSTVYSMLEVNGGAVYLEAGEGASAVSISASGSVTLYGWNGSAWETYSEHRYLSTDNSKAPSQWTW